MRREKKYGAFFVNIDEGGGQRSRQALLPRRSEAQTRADGTSVPPHPHRLHNVKKESVGVNRQIPCKSYFASVSFLSKPTSFLAALLRSKSGARNGLAITLIGLLARINESTTVRAK